jgi:hypothetical protein
MATNLTLEELQAPVVPDSWQAIPPEHRFRYYILAIDQLAMVQKTLTELALVQMNPVPRDTVAQVSGCIAGLKRVEMWLQGYRT